MKLVETEKEVSARRVRQFTLLLAHWRTPMHTRQQEKSNLQKMNKRTFSPIKAWLEWEVSCLSCFVTSKNLVVFISADPQLHGARKGQALQRRRCLQGRRKVLESIECVSM